MLSLHFPDLLGTAPKGLMMKSGRGGDKKEPAVRPSVHSLAMYALITSGGGGKVWREMRMAWAPVACAKAKGEPWRRYWVHCLLGWS